MGAGGLEGDVYPRELSGVVGGGGCADPHARRGVGDDGAIVLDMVLDERRLAWRGAVFG